MSYYIVKVYGLVCDVAGCDGSEECIPLIDEPNKLAAARRELANPPSSWRHINGRDVCPKDDQAHMDALVEQRVSS